MRHNIKLSIFNLYKIQNRWILNNTSFLFTGKHNSCRIIESINIVDVGIRKYLTFRCKSMAGNSGVITMVTCVLDTSLAEMIYVPFFVLQCSYDIFTFSFIFIETFMWILWGFYEDLKRFENLGRWEFWGLGI